MIFPPHSLRRADSAFAWLYHESAAPDQARWDLRVVQVIRLFQAHLSKPWYLEELAAAVHLCPRQLERLFQHETHVTPLQYLKRLRLARAAELLVTTNLESKEVCLQVGYQDVSQFSVDFKRVFHCTPRQYRQQQGRLA